MFSSAKTFCAVACGTKEATASPKPEHFVMCQRAGPIPRLRKGKSKPFNFFSPLRVKLMVQGKSRAFFYISCLHLREP